MVHVIQALTSPTTGRPPFTALGRCHFFFFSKLKASPSTSRKITVRFIAILTLLGWCGWDPGTSLGFACIALEQEKKVEMS